MKSLFPLLLLTLLLPFCGISQKDALTSKVPVDEDDQIKYQEVITIAQDEKAAFNKIKEWFLNNKTLHGAFATTINREGGRVSGKGKFEFTHTLLTVPYEYRIHYILTTDSKDQKVRITLSNFIIEEKGNKTNKWKSRDWPAEKNILDELCYNKKGKVKASCKKFKGPIVDFVNKVIKSFEKAMQETDDF